MIPILLCAYRPRYLGVVLQWLQPILAGGDYRLFAWDNGGAAAQFRQAGLEWHCTRDEATQQVINVGKALAMQYLMDVVNAEMPDADCYVCMDDDIIADRAQLAALVAAARRPGLGMIAPRFHPFNSVVPAGGRVQFMDACPLCLGVPDRSTPEPCSACGGTGTDRAGLLLRTYPIEDRTMRNQGCVAGGMFALSKAALGRLDWAPYPYPILMGEGERPVLYWTEDATLDFALTTAGLTNGYLEGDEYTPVIHLPELDPTYVEWKRKARQVPPTEGFEIDEPDEH